VRLDNGSANRLGLGALVHLERPGAPPAMRRVRTDGSYLSASDPTLHFGLGEWRGPVTLRVEWPAGSAEQWNIPKVNQRVVLVRGRGTALPHP
jgi:enediyne biosynthesis protein E4